MEKNVHHQRFEWLFSNGVILKSLTTPTTLPDFITVPGMTHCTVFPMAAAGDVHPKLLYSFLHVNTNPAY
jgi:hypothetical protein